MNKWILSILLMTGLCVSAQAQGRYAGTLNRGNTNTTTAAIVVPPVQGADVVKVTDLAATTAGTGANYNIFVGRRGYSVNVAVAAATTNIFVASTSGLVAGDNVIFEDTANTNWERLVIHNVPSTTNFNVTSAVTSAQPIGKRFYQTSAVIERDGIPDLSGSVTNVFLGTPVEIYLPGNLASAIEVAGGTTATKISVSGVYLGN